MDANFFGMGPSSGYKHAGTPELEVYSDEDPSSPDLYSEIWIPVV